MATNTFVWELDYPLPTSAQAFQAVNIVWAWISGTGEKPPLALFARALHCGIGYGIKVGLPGATPAAAVAVANPEARLKEVLNPYFGQHPTSNVGQNKALGAQAHSLLNLNWAVVVPLLLQLLKIYESTQKIEATMVESAAIPSAMLIPPMPTEPAASEPVAESDLPGYPSREPMD